MIISYNSIEWVSFHAHSSRKEAVNFILKNLDLKYKDIFAASPDGENICLIKNNKLSLGIEIRIFNSEQEALYFIIDEFTHPEELANSLSTLSSAISLGFTKAY